MKSWYYNISPLHFFLWLLIKNVFIQSQLQTFKGTFDLCYWVTHYMIHNFVNKDLFHFCRSMFVFLMDTMQCKYHYFYVNMYIFFLINDYFIVMVFVHDFIHFFIKAYTDASYFQGLHGLSLPKHSNL